MFLLQREDLLLNTLAHFLYFVYLPFEIAFWVQLFLALYVSCQAFFVQDPLQNLLDHLLCVVHFVASDQELDALVGINLHIEFCRDDWRTHLEIVKIVLLLSHCFPFLCQAEHMHHRLQSIEAETIQLECPVGYSLLALNLLLLKCFSIILTLNLTEDLHLDFLNDV